MSKLANHGRSFIRMMVVLRRIPRPVLIGMVALALGLGVNTAIFTRGYFDFLRHTMIQTGSLFCGQRCWGVKKVS